MQILLSGSAHERIGDRVRALAPGAEVIAAVAVDRFERDGQAIPATEVDPEVAWLSGDTMEIPGLFKALREHLVECESLRWVQVFMAGLDSGAFTPLMAKGVRLSKSSAQGVAIAEYVVAHALAFRVPIDAQRAAQLEHRWTTTPYVEMSQSRWLLVGYGSIGRQIAKRIKPFGAQLTAVRRDGGPDDLTDQVARPRELLAILPEADIVVLACPLTAETRGMADAAFFAAMKPGALLINIARGALVDEEALRAGLDRDQPARAVLDVFTTEPLPPDAWFWDHPKVRVSAHTSPFGSATVARGEELFLANLKRYLDGQPVANEARPFEVGL